MSVRLIAGIWAILSRLVVLQESTHNASVNPLPSTISHVVSEFFGAPKPTGFEIGLDEHPSRTFLVQSV
jgi:hypothetical protein